MDIELAKKVAIEAARDAGKIIAARFGKLKNASSKGKSDIVTDADLEAEKIILERIRTHFPDHRILSEEAGLSGGGSKYLWMVDPLDGTMNYYYGYGMFSVEICLLENGKPLISAIYRPLEDKLFFAERDKGATMNGAKLAVNKSVELKDCIIMTHLSSKDEGRIRTIKLLNPIFSESMHMRILGDSFAPYIASGMSALYFNVKIKPWDILPDALIVEEAGGKVTEINGGEITEDSTSVLASPNEKVHERMLELLKNA